MPETKQPRVAGTEHHFSVKKVTFKESFKDEEGEKDNQGRAQTP